MLQIIHFSFVSILAGGAFAPSLAAIEASRATIENKFDALRNVEIEWQSVLKKSSEKPDAVYKILRSADGFPTLIEIAAVALEASQQTPAEPKK